MTRRLHHAALLAALTWAAACASTTPTPQTTPPDAATPQDDPATPPPQRSRLIAAPPEEAAEVDEVERIAQDYTRRVEALFNARQDEINACYLRELKRDPRLQGAFVVEFTVLSGGRIGQGPRTSQDSLRSKAVEACIFDLLRAITYPEPYNGEYANIKRAFTFGAF